MSKDTNPKTTNIARVAITSGPAAAAAEIQKNKKKRMSKTHTHLPPHLTNSPRESQSTDLLLGTDTATPPPDTAMSVADENISSLGAHAHITRPIVSYPSTVISPTPSPTDTELFADNRPPSPTPPSPSPQRTPTSTTLTTHTPPTTQPDITMEDLPADNSSHTINPDHPPPPKTYPTRPLAPSCSEGSITITRAPPPPHHRPPLVPPKTPGSRSRSQHSPALQKKPLP